MKNLIPQAAVEAAKEVDTMVTPFENWTVKCHDDYENSAKYLKEIKTKLGQIEEVRFSITKPLDTAKKAVMDFFRAPTEKLQKAETRLKSAMIDWQKEVARLAAIEQAKIEAAAKAAAEAEKAELEAKAVKLVQSGKVEQAANLIAKSEDIQPVEMTLKVVQPVVQGISTREIWKFEVIDVDKVPRQFMIVDEKALGVMARQSKGMTPIPGVRFFSETIIGA